MIDERDTWSRLPIWARGAILGIGVPLGLYQVGHVAWRIFNG